MKKQSRRVLIFLPLAVLALSACEDTNELYRGDAYVSTVFVENRYNVWDSRIKEASISKEVVLNQTDASYSKGYFCGSGKATKPADCRGLEQAKKYANSKNRAKDFKNSKGADLKWTYTGTAGDYKILDADIIDHGVGVWADQSPLVDIVYGQTKKLNLINNKFSRGYLSKLYNGQIQCDAWSSYSLVELDKSGYGTMFPVELEAAPYFAFSARGGSDTKKTPRITTFDITVTFYKYVEKKLTGFSVTMSDVNLQTNYSAEYTSLVGFYFDDVDYDPKGVVGMSMTYSLVHDDVSPDIKITDDFDDLSEGTYHTGLILLEVFFPDSTWN